MLLFFKEHFQPIVFQELKDLKTGEMLYERRYLSPRPPPKISLTHDHDWTKGNDQLGSTVEHRPVGKLVQQSLGETLQAGSSKPTQPKPNPIGDRTGKPVEEENMSCSREIVGEGLQGELGSSDRTGKPVKREDNRVMNDHDRTGKPVEAGSHEVQVVGSLEHRDDADKFNLAINEENIDFNISGVPNAMVKRSHGINVHNLIQQIENHPQRQALQSDLQQHQAFNPFSEDSKDAIMAAGNTELCEIVDVEPKSTMQSMPDVLERWHRLLHMWTPCERWCNRKQEVHLTRAGVVLHPELLHQEGSTRRSQVREETRMQRIPHGKTTSKKVSKETLRKHSRSIYS